MRLYSDTSSPLLSIHKAIVGHSTPLFSIDEAHLSKGKITLLVGDNGCGKTTLFQSILKQVSLLRGEVFIEGKSLSEYPIKVLAQKIAMVFSKPHIPLHYTVWDTVAMGKFVHYPYYFQLKKEDKKHIEQILETLHLDEIKHTPLSHLSDGNLQKTFIGMALAQDTPLIILDEPTTHLDKNNTEIIFSALKNITKNTQKSILLSSHDWQIASTYCNDIWLIDNKALFVGLAEDMMIKHDYFHKKQEKFFGKNFAPPKIIGDYQKSIFIIQALKKHFNRDLSSFRIEILPNEDYLIFFQQKETKKHSKSILEIIDFIEKVIL